MGDGKCISWNQGIHAALASPDVRFGVRSGHPPGHRNVRFAPEEVVRAHLVETRHKMKSAARLPLVIIASNEGHLFPTKCEMAPEHLSISIQNSPPPA